MANEQIGAALARCAVHELTTSEVIWRLTGPDDRAFDIGANVGYFTSLLSVRASSVRAFEPHPMLRQALARNVGRWTRANASIDPHAVSDREGAGRLTVPPSFLFTQGTATLLDTAEPLAGFDVDLTTLDAIVDGPVGLAKIDVEGHEPAVLAGGERVLSDGLIRDIVFEEHDVHHSATIAYLRDHGYTVFGLAERFLGVELVDPLSPRAVPRWDAPNFLATLAPERATRRMAPRGWRSLRARG